MVAKRLVPDEMKINSIVGHRLIIFQCRCILPNITRLDNLKFLINYLPALLATLRSINRVIIAALING